MSSSETMIKKWEDPEFKNKMRRAFKKRRKVSWGDKISKALKGQPKPHNRGFLQQLLILEERNKICQEKRSLKFGIN